MVSNFTKKWLILGLWGLLVAELDVCRMRDYHHCDFFDQISLIIIWKNSAHYPLKLKVLELRFQRWKKIIFEITINFQTLFDGNWPNCISGGIISPIHTFVNIPALILKNTLRFLIRAGILTKVWIWDIFCRISS
jgi:hypothetical protein